MFVGRPYCRFFCPYGALLKLAGLASKWRVTVTPNICKQCRMCSESCPYGALREPAYLPVIPEPPERARRRMILMVIALPFLVAVGALLGAKLGVPAARLHPTVSLAEHYSRYHHAPQQFPPMTPEALSLERAEANPQAVLEAARKLQERFALAGWLFGGWVGLVIGIKLLSLSVRAVGSDYEPDRGACVACARCFEDCPRHVRAAKGLPPTEECMVPEPAPAQSAEGKT
jgi:ferredoxin